MVRKFFVLGILVFTMAAGNRLESEGHEWWKDVEYLSCDELQGRNMGTRGFDRAANYVAEQYERTGLKAAGGDGYFQKISFSEASLNTAAIRLIRMGRTDAVSIPTEVLIHFDAHSKPEVRARVVFAGYGLKVPEADYDDLKGLPVKGAIVAFLSGTPDEVPGNLRTHYSMNETRWQTLKEAGAIGMIEIPNPKHMEAAWSRQAATISLPRMSLADPQIDRFQGLAFSATWNPAQADDLLAGSGHTFSEIVEADANRTALPHFPVGCVLKSIMAVSSRMLTSKNVVALHRGSDESLKDEYVVVSAHLDHLGISNASHGDTVYHGAMDDASGVSSVIEIARMLRSITTKRSILFVAFTGEEKGELGSEYFAQNPPVRGKIVADLNMDMFLPIVPLKWLDVQGLGESTLGGDIRAVAQEAGVRVLGERESDNDRFIHSDQYSFAKAGVPAVAFKFGYQKGDPEEKVFQDWYAHRYHTVKDNTDQPVDLEAAAKFNQVLRALLIRVADAGEAPKWQARSVFKRFAAADGM